jgi:hypothetical protein
MYSAGAKSVQAFLLSDRLPMKSIGEAGQQPQPQQAGAGGGRRDGPPAPLETLLVERKLADSNIHREAVKEKGHSEGGGSQI